MSTEEMNVSPTQVSKARRCWRIIAFEYVEGIKPPPSVKQVFGTDVHKQLERWLSKGVPPDDTPEGRTAKQGIKKGWLPTPGPHLMTEHRMRYQVIPGVFIKGYIDCVAPYEISEKISGPLVIDHKTTSDLRWAKTEEELASDPQALMYVAWAMLHFGVPEVLARWVYYAASNPTGKSPRAPRGAKPVQRLFDSRDPAFIELVAGILRDVHRIVYIRRTGIKALDLPPSPGSCGMYGGCAHEYRCNLSGGDRIAAYMGQGVRT